MSITLQSTPTSNTLDLTVTFFSNNAQVASLAYNESKTLDIKFDAIGVGNSQPLSMFKQETPGDITIVPGFLAFVDRSIVGKIALRYGQPGGTQQNIVFGGE